VTAAAFFDLDKTVIAKSSTLAFGRPFYEGGLVNRRAVLKSSFAQFVYLLQGADEETMDRLRDYLAKLCAGWPVQQVHDIVSETLHDLIDPLVYEEALELFAEHRAAGREVILVSSSGEEIVGPVGRMLGVDRVIATRMVVEDGHYTGEVDFYAYGENKATAIADLAAEEGWDLEACFAYSDSVTDLPMLAAVGHPVAVNADKALRKEATERDWPMLVFALPVRAQRRLPTPPGPRAAYVLGVVAAVLAVTVWALARRPRER
jgi:HAD superfamily hydrolase (TIGR01490 family)